VRYRHRPPHRRRWGRRGEPAAVLLVTEDDPVLVRAAAAAGHTVWRYRSELAPVTTTAALALAGAWAHARHPGWALPLAVLTAALTAALAVPPGRWPPGRWASRWRLLARPAERLYAASVVGLAGAWLAAATAWGPGTRPLPAVAVLATLAAGVPWWADRRRRARVRLDRVIARWPTFAEAVGLPGSRILSAVAHTWGWSARLALRRGQTAQHVLSAAGAVESALAVRPGAVQVQPDPGRADRALLRVVEHYPLSTPIRWPGAPADHPATVLAPAEVGVFDDGSPVAVRLAYRNVLVGGIAGSGKSGVLNALLATLVSCPDAVVWGIDLKGGMELRPWAPCLGRLATTPHEAVTLLAAARAVRDQRAATTASRLWQPSPAGPALLVVIDEYAELPDHAKQLADSVARVGRAVMVNLLAATQRPTQHAMGGGAARAQMDIRVCLRVRERRDTDLVLGQGMHTAGWRADLLDTPGTFLLCDPEHTHPHRARAYLLTDHDVRQAADRNTGHRPTLPTPSDPHPDPAPRTSPGPHRPDPVQQLRRALDTAPADGVPVSALIEATGKSRTWVYDRLAELAATGQATRTRRGRWRATHPTTGSHPT